MTCVVGIVRENDVMIGADSAGTSGDWTLVTRADPKVFTIHEGKFVIGFTTSYRMGQLLRFGLTPPDHPDGMDAYEYMVRHFIPAVRQCFKDGGYAIKDKEQESAGQFLVGYEGRLFSIDSDYQVGESAEQFDAYGCGQAAALGAVIGQLLASAERDYERIVRYALQTAERFNGGVRGPFRIETGGAITKTPVLNGRAH